MYISDKEHVLFLLFLWTYNFSCQIKQSQRDIRLKIILLPGVPTLSPFPILQQTTNKTLVSLLSFKEDLMPKNMILTQFSPLAIETDRYGKILFKNMQVLLITRLSAIDPGQLN